MGILPFIKKKVEGFSFVFTVYSGLRVCFSPIWNLAPGSFPQTAGEKNPVWKTDTNGGFPHWFYPRLNPLSRLRRQLPRQRGNSFLKGSGLGKEMKFAWTAKGSPFGRAGAQRLRGRGRLRKGELPRQRARPLRHGLRRATLPLLSLCDIFPRRGGSLSSKGEALAKPKALRFDRKLSRDTKSSPFRGSWHRAAMTERVGRKNKPSRADKVPERAYKTIFYALAAAQGSAMRFL